MNRSRTLRERSGAERTHAADVRERRGYERWDSPPPAGIVAAPRGRPRLVRVGGDFALGWPEPGPPPALHPRPGRDRGAGRGRGRRPNLLHATEHNLVAVAGLLVASLMAAGDPPLGQRARPPVRLSSVFLFVVYLVFVLNWTLNSSTLAGEHGRRRAALGARGVRSAGPVLRRLLMRWAPKDRRRRITPAPLAARCGRARSPRRGACMSRRTTSRQTWSSRRSATCSAWTTWYEVILIDDNTDDDALAPGRGMVLRHGVEVRPPGGLARLQVRRAELRTATHRRGRRSDRRGLTPTTRSSCIPARLRPRAFARPRAGRSSLRRTTATGTRTRSPAAVLLIQVLLRHLPAVTQRA